MRTSPSVPLTSQSSPSPVSLTSCCFVLMLCFFPPDGSFQSRQRTGGIYQRELCKCFMSAPPTVLLIQQVGMNYRAVRDLHHQSRRPCVSCLVVFWVQHCYMSPQHLFTRGQKHDYLLASCELLHHLCLYCSSPTERVFRHSVGGR